MAFTLALRSREIAVASVEVREATGPDKFVSRATRVDQLISR